MRTVSPVALFGSVSGAGSKRDGRVQEEGTGVKSAEQPCLPPAAGSSLGDKAGLPMQACSAGGSRESRGAIGR